MKYIFAGILLVDAVLGFYYPIHYIITKRIKITEEKWFMLASLASGIWSVGFGFLPLQIDATKAYFCRMFGMVGVFLYFIFALVLVCNISYIKKKVRGIVYAFASLGIPLYFFVVAPGAAEYYMKNGLMTYRFNPGDVNNLYTAYSCCLAVILFTIIFYTIKTSELKRVKDFAKKMLWVALLLVLGMVLDTIFPLIGLSAIPGSSITQFWAILLLYFLLLERRKSEVNVHNMSEFIYYSLVNPVLVYDSNRTIKIANDAATAFFEFEEVGNQKNQAYVTYLFDVEADDVFGFEGENTSIDAVCIKNKIDCNISVSKINDKYGDLLGYILIITDVSERKKTLISLEKAKEEADIANKSKSMFLANMSHEIRTPMNSIIGFAELSLNSELPDEVREYVGDIRRSANTLLSLINEILDISKIESGNMELIETEYLLENIIKDVYLIIEMQAKKKNLSFSVDIEGDIPRRMLGDKTRLREILINLLANAVKYTEKGSVKLKISNRSRSFDVVELEFDVIDTGIGIKEEDKKQIFELFSRVDLRNTRQIEGTGLGLALTKGYLELMGGELEVESVYGEGSTFKVIVKQKIIDDAPVQFSMNISDADEKSSMGNIRLRDTEVLVVDDNQINLKVIQHSMMHYGLKVTVAGSGIEAIKLCENNRFDIIFMDQMMPEMDGVQSMKEIRKLNPYYSTSDNCKIIVLTANAISGARTELIKEGFDEYLSKPIDYSMLEELFEKLLRKEKIYYTEDEKVLVTDKKEKEGSNMSEILNNLKTIIDIEKGLMYCANSEDIYLSVIALFVKNSEKQIEELKNFYEKKDVGNFTISIHSIKGSCLNIGADEQAAVAKDLEMAGKRDDMQYIEGKIGDFLTEYTDFVQMIKDILVNGGIEIPVDKKVSIGEYLEKLQDCVDSYDIAGMTDIIKDMKKTLSDEDLEKIKELEMLVDEIDIEGISEWIKVN